MFGKRCFWLFLPVFVLLVTSPSMNAQSASTGLVSGAVSDPSGAIVVGASVTLIDHGTGVQQVATTGKDGRYVFPAVNPGDYSLSFAAQV
jgi:hypothetical protein